MAERRPFRFRIPDGEISGDAWAPEREGSPGAAIIVCHGFKGFKDWGFFPTLCGRLADATGRLTVGFNFDGSGVRRSTDRFDDLEAFGHNTFSRELGDLEAIMDRLAVGRLGDVTVEPAVRYGLVGHSRGGATAILAASRRHQVEALVTWASISSTERYARMLAEAAARGEAVTIPNARTGQDMPLYRNVLDDLEANTGRLDIGVAAGFVSAPWLIVHGTDDETVPVDDALQLARAAPHAELLQLDGAGHTFGAAHPFEREPPALRAAIFATAGHMSSHLRFTSRAHLATS